MSSAGFIYLATEYLNNQALELLKKRCFRQALEIFADGLEEIKVLANNRVGDHMQTTALSFHTDCTIQKLDKAASRVSSVASVISEDLKSDPFTLTVIANMESLPISLLTDEQEVESTLYLIQVHSDSIGEYPNDVELALRSSILMYNYGITYRCMRMSPCSHAQDMNERLDRKAFQLFEAVRCALRVCGRDHHESGLDFPFHSITLLLNLLLLPHLAKIALQQGSKSSASFYMNQLGSVRATTTKFVAIREALEVHFAAAMA